jgi:hypothetical protein
MWDPTIWSLVSNQGKYMTIGLTDIELIRPHNKKCCVLREYFRLNPLLRLNHLA